MMTTRPKVEESKTEISFRDIIERMATLHEAKNHDYGNSFNTTLDKYGPVASLVRIEDKLNRLSTLLKDKASVPKFLHAVQHVGADKYGTARLFKLYKYVFKLFNGVRVKANKRLVEKQNLWLRQKGAAHGKLLLHTFGKLLAQLVFFIPKLHSF